MRINASRLADRMGQHGNAMLLVLLLTSTALGITTVAYRASDDAIRVEDYQRDRDFRDQVITSALAGGVQLLRTGEPVAEPFRYVVPTKISDGSTFYTLVEIKKNPDAKAKGSEPYIVTAQPGTLADSVKCGPPPSDFGSGDDDEDDGGSKKDKDNNGIGWGVGGIPPGADKGNKGGKD